MKKIFILIIICFTIIFSSLTLFSAKIEASEKGDEITISDSSITINGENLSTDSSKGVYLSTAMNNGGSNHQAQDANIKDLTVINIQQPGIYQLSGKLSNGQISVNANKIEGEVNLILNNVEIRCEEAPAIFVYHKDPSSENCKVTIQVSGNEENIITGARLKEDVQAWEGQEELEYYIDKGTDEDGTYYERYKYDGAISSDVSLTFEGGGKLTVNSIDKEGIESKQDITINEGNYIINSMDDGINASTDGESTITINNGNIFIKLGKEAGEGDGIDSNGSLVINNGTVYAFSCETSQDNGIDAEKSVEINGGYVVGTSNMQGMISQNSKQTVLQIQFNETIEAGKLITIVDEDKNPVAALRSDRSYKILTISMPELNSKEYSVYIDGKLEGESENGFFTKITSYELGTLKETTILNTNMQKGFSPQGNLYLTILIILVVILIGLIILTILLKKRGEFEMKGKILVLIIGIIVGAIITTTGFLIFNNINKNDMQEPGVGGGRGQMPLGMEMPQGEMPEGQRPEKPRDENI